MDIRDIYKNFVELENKEKITECSDDMPMAEQTSVNISMSGRNASEVEQLMKMFKNAGMEPPKMDMPPMPSKIGGPGNAPCPICGKVHVGAGQGCMGEDEVAQEEYDNAPDELYQDDNYMTGDMGDDMHRKKDRKAIRTTQPALEAEIKEALLQALNEKKGTCSECGKPSYTTLPEEKQKGVDGKVCWKGYKRMGTKKKGGKTVDNCVKM